MAVLEIRVYYGTLYDTHFASLHINYNYLQNCHLLICVKTRLPLRCMVHMHSNGEYNEFRCEACRRRYADAGTPKSNK